MSQPYIEPTQESAMALISRNISGEIFMLNLLRLRATADYRQFPELAPGGEISGREAFQKYIDHTLPLGFCGSTAKAGAASAPTTNAVAATVS
jgi:hypothetical protein